MRKLAVAFAVIVVATVAFACSSAVPTIPESVTSGETGSVPTTSVVPTPAPTATPAATPVGERPYVTFQEPLGNGEFCNPMTHPLTLTVEYWNANVFTSQVLLKTEKFTAQPKTCVLIPSANDIVKLQCGEKVRVQIDAATTEHLGHIFVDLVGPDEKETVTEVVTYTDWSECKADSQGCLRTRTKVVTTTKSYVCKETVVEVVKTEEKESCACPCVEEWKELKPEITYGEWGECKADASASTVSPECSRSRTVRTVIKEQNSCTEQIRIKSDTTKQESEPCECRCVEEWIELPKPEVSYTDWSECSKPSQRDLAEGCVEEKCYQSRSKITIYKEVNTCTKVEREKKREVETERRECPCKIEKTCANTPASSNAAQGFSLPNSGDATELGWVDDNVELGPWKLIDRDQYSEEGGEGECKDADIFNSSTAKVALVKAGTKYIYYLNVMDVAKLCSYDGKDISHITYFICK